MSWVSIIPGVLSLINFIVKWAHERQLISEANTTIIADAKKAQSDETKVANDAGEAVAADLAAHHERVRIDDGFKRPSNGASPGRSP